MLAWSSARRLIFFLALWRWPALAKGDSAENLLRNKENMAAYHIDVGLIFSARTDILSCVMALACVGER